MKARTMFAQNGQTLILVALAMVALMALVALGVDVGHLYGERRRMQNAADAGALAGAHEICFGDPSMAVARAQEYAITRNGAQTADVTVNGGTVEVVAGETVDAFFAGIIGIPTTDVEAEAAASCGQAEKACGLWPVAFDYGLWHDQLDEGCDKAFYVWTGDNSKNAKDPDCDIYDCDVDNDGVDDIFPAEGRGWLDFTYALDDDPRYPDPCAPGQGHGSSSHGCGTKELSCWLLNDTGAPITLPACIDGDPGTRSATKDEVNARIGDAVSVALYDSRGCSCDGCHCGETYHVIDFGCITVLGWEQKLELPRLDGHKPDWKGKMIRAAVNCGGCQTNCGSTGGDPLPPWGVGAVSLIR